MKCLHSPNCQLLWERFASTVQCFFFNLVMWPKFNYIFYKFTSIQNEWSISIVNRNDKQNIYYHYTFNINLLYKMTQIKHVFQRIASSDCSLYHVTWILRYTASEFDYFKIIFYESNITAYS